MKEMNRRDFVKWGGGAAAAGAATVGSVGLAMAGDSPIGAVTLPYPRKTIGAMDELRRQGFPVMFTYPDGDSPCALLKVGRSVPGGVGPDRDIVAYSILCPHMGCALQYDGDGYTLKCPCHFSIFDVEQAGQQVCGQATENLPRIVLEYWEDEGAVDAVAVEGLIYGRQANIVKGE